MEHIAIMKKSWWLINKILQGIKTVETRWYNTKYPPFDRIKEWEIIYFKDSWNPVMIKAIAEKVEQFENLYEERTSQILEKYAFADLWTDIIPKEIENYTKNKKYCIVIHLKCPEEIKPFNINKKWFWAMTSWICIDSVEKIKI